MFVLCVHAVGVDSGRQGEGAGEASVITLDPLVAVRFTVLFDLSLAADRQRVAFERQMNILFPHARHFHLNDDAVIFLINVRSPYTISSPSTLFVKLSAMTFRKL
jgi:hypothetical protein